MNKTFIRLAEPLDIKDGDFVQIADKKYQVSYAYISGIDSQNGWTYYVDGKVNKGDVVTSSSASD